MDTKSIFTSKTFWLNLCAFIIAAATYIDPELLTYIGVDPTLQMTLMKLVGTAVALANLGLRMLTNKPVTVSFKKVVPLLLIAIGLLFISSCAGWNSLKQHTAIEIVQKPISLNDTFSVTGKLWGVGDMINQFAPANNKTGDFFRTATKNCKVTILQFPNHDVNDTIAVNLKCHSMGQTAQELFPKLKK